jgi:hypothetical protein
LRLHGDLLPSIRGDAPLSEAPLQPLEHVGGLGFQSSLQRPPDDPAEHTALHVPFGSIHIDEIVGASWVAAHERCETQRRIDVTVVSM